MGENQSDSLNTLAFGMRLRDMKPRKSHQNKYHTASKTERMLTQMNQELRLTIDKLESDVRECAFESQSDHEAWQIILQDLHQVIL